MKKIFIISSVIILFCAGCATTYHERGFWGDGYSEVRTSPDSFIVTFKGNASTNHDEVTKYTLLRASELTLLNGYKYFVILSSQDRTSSYDYVQTETNISNEKNLKHQHKGLSESCAANASTKITSGTVVKPGRSVQIKCFEEKPLSDEPIDAVFYWNANSK